MVRKIIYSLVLFLVIITPFVYSNDLYDGLISAKQIWFYGVMGLLLLVASLDILFSKKTIALKINDIDKALLVFYGYYLIRTATTPYMPILYNQRFLNWTLLVIMYFILKRVFNSGSQEYIGNAEKKLSTNNREQNKIEGFNFRAFITLCLVLTGLGQAIWGLLQLYGFLPSFNNNFKITGSFFNPAPYALYLAVVLPVAIGNILVYEGMKGKRKNVSNNKSYFLTFHYLQYYLSIATVISILLVLPATMIRTSWFASTVGIFFVLWPWLKQHTRLGPWFKVFSSKARYIIVATMFAFTIVGIVAYGLFKLKEGSSNGKLLIWKVTISKIAEKPLFGYGVGRFSAEYNNWQAAYFLKNSIERAGEQGQVAGNTKYAFNDYLELLAELGIAGITLFLWLLISICLVAFRNLAQADNVNVRSKQSYLRPAMGAFWVIIVSATVSFPFYSLPTLIVFFVSISYFEFFAVSPSLKNKQTAIKPASNKVQHYAIKYLTVVSLIILSLLLINQFSKQYDSYLKWKKATILYNADNYGEACQLFDSLLEPMQFNGDYLQYFGKSIYYAKAPDCILKSIKMLECAKKFTSDEVLYTSFGDCFKAIKQYKKAEESYFYASFMVPYKLYPKYLIAKLYDDTRQTKKALDMAQQVINTVPKIKSKTSDEMQEEMKQMVLKISLHEHFK